MHKLGVQRLIACWLHCR